MRADERLAEQVELAAYYAVAEALTNAAKPAHASTVDFRVEAAQSGLRISVRDDGRGGATFARGSGLIGLTDRVEALGGRLSLLSPPDAGTTVAITIPFARGGTTGPPRARRPADRGEGGDAVAQPAKDSSDGP